VSSSRRLFAAAVLAVDGIRTLVAITITGDSVCRSTNVDYRLDTASARAFLAPFVALP
jgi:hypothetical protein